MGFHWWPQKSQNFWHFLRVRTLSLATYTCGFSHLANFTFAPCFCYYLSSLTKVNASYNGGKQRIHAVCACLSDTLSPLTWVINIVRLYEMGDKIDIFLKMQTRHKRTRHFVCSIQETECNSWKLCQGYGGQ